MLSGSEVEALRRRLSRLPEILSEPGSRRRPLLPLRGWFGRRLLRPPTRAALSPAP